MPDNDETFELSDIDVTTLGLVRDGANREEFFLVKSADGTSEITEEPAISKSLWQRVVGLFKTAIEAEVATLKLEDVRVEGTPEMVTSMGLSDISHTTELVSDVTVESVPATEVVADENKSITEIPASAELMQAITLEVTSMSDEAQIDMTKLADLEKANVDLLARLTAAEQEIAKEKEGRERDTFLAKARTLTALPISPDELADHMYWLSKTDAKRAEWFEAILKAVDNMVTDAGLFVEKGTSKGTAGDAIEQASKSADPRTALLAINPVAAEAYLKQARQSARGM